MPSIIQQTSETMAKLCPNCNAADALVQIISRACDGNIVLYPDGRESNGYLPEVAGLCTSDGLAIQICTTCGQLNGLDRAKLRESFQ